jgi:hypothetical protein
MVDVGGLVVDVVSPLFNANCSMTRVRTDTQPVKPISSTAPMSSPGELHTMMDHPPTPLSYSIT